MEKYNKFYSKSGHENITSFGIILTVGYQCTGSTGWSTAPPCEASKISRAEPVWGAGNVYSACTVYTVHCTGWVYGGAGQSRPAVRPCVGTVCQSVAALDQMDTFIKDILAKRPSQPLLSILMMYLMSNMTQSFL